jgi:hypothetical protein
MPAPPEAWASVALAPPTAVVAFFIFLFIAQQINVLTFACKHFIYSYLK